MPVSETPRTQFPYTLILPESARDQINILYQEPEKCIIEYLPDPPASFWPD